MQIVKIAFFFAALICLIQAQGIYEMPQTSFPTNYGVPFKGFPSYDERSVNLMVNMFRVAPGKTKTDFLVPLMKAGDTSANNVFTVASTLPAQRPLIWNYNVNRAARAHSQDVNINCATTLTHNDCNGTAPATRIGKFGTTFSNSQYSGENFINSNTFASYTLCANFKRIWPILSTSSFVCDGTYNTNCNLVGCVTDTDARAGHRKNIMSTNHKQVASGNIWNANGKTAVLTHDFSYSPLPTVYTSVRLIAGSHLWSVSTATQTTYTFYAVINLQDTDTFKSLVVETAGTTETMTFYAGISNKVGIYKSTSRVQPVGQCHTYRFKLTYNTNVVQVYPASGAFQTSDGTTTCAADWVNEVATRSISNPQPQTANQGTADIPKTGTAAIQVGGPSAPVSRPFFQSDSEKIVFALAIVVTVLVVSIFVILLVKFRRANQGSYSEPLLK